MNKLDPTHLEATLRRGSDDQPLDAEQRDLITKATTALTNRVGDQIAAVFNRLAERTNVPGRYLAIVAREWCDSMLRAADTATQGKTPREIEVEQVIVAEARRFCDAFNARVDADMGIARAPTPAPESRVVRIPIAVTPPGSDTPAIRAWIEDEAQLRGYADFEWRTERDSAGQSIARLYGAPEKKEVQG